MSESFTLIVLGLFRKIVIADTLFATIPGNLFGAPEEFSGLQIFIWILTWLFAIYNDFCGYTNTVRGISGFFGITLSRNFKHPFLSRSLTEFWNRWHISLSLWLRDYIFLPLGRNLKRRFYHQKNNILLVFIPPIVTFLASGLWHAFTSSFLIWGFLVGLVIGFEGFFSFRRPKIPRDQAPRLKQWGSRILLFGPGLILLSVCQGNISFVIEFISGFFKTSPWALPDSRVFLLIIPSLWIDFVQNRRKSEFVFLTWKLPIRSLLLALAIILIFLFVQGKIPQPFIYQGF